MQGSGDLNALNVEQFLQRLKRKGVPLQFEIGAFVALETCEAIVDKPVRVGRDCVWVNEQGQVAVAEEAPRSDSELQAVRSLLDLLSDLLLASAPGVPEDLLRLVDAGSETAARTLKSLRDELEASLVPLNRQATRRVLARLVREATAQGERPNVAPPQRIKQSELDASFDDLVGYTTAEAGETTLDSGRTGSPGTISPNPDLEPEGETEAGPVPEHHRRSMEQFEEADREQATLFRYAASAVVLLLVALLIGYSLLTDSRSGGLGCDRHVQPSEPAAKRADPAVPVAPSPVAEEKKPAVDIARGGRLTVNSSPQGAQVLMYVGIAPLTMAGLPLRVAHEFVSVADGRQPVRAVIPADAAWRDTADGPRYELALQSGGATEPGNEWTLGPTGLPRDPGSPSGKLGAVRVETAPAGMRVYRLLGFTPDLRVDNLPVGETAHLVLYESGYSPAKVAVEPGSWIGSDDGPKAEIDITLEKM